MASTYILHCYLPYRCTPPSLTHSFLVDLSGNSLFINGKRIDLSATTFNLFDLLSEGEYMSTVDDDGDDDNDDKNNDRDGDDDNGNGDDDNKNNDYDDGDDDNNDDDNDIS